ncbi:vezatin-like [Asterias amurensis]|uniref:vezatin-like n=1 Tax=Asterias amurensis TaxID=7602 RepID=UPI003AB19098
MADDCYDDEVLLENSPLSQYLREACPDQEFDTVPSARKSVQPVVEKKIYTVSGFVHAAQELLLKFFQWLYPSVIEHVNATFVPEYSALALESRCLFDSDKQIVSAYYPKIGLSKSHGVSLASYNRIWFFGFCCLFFLCIDLGACVHLLPASLASSLPHLPVVLSFNPVLQVACYLYTPFLIHLIWTVFTLKRRHKKGIGCMKQCLRLLDQQGALLRKCIRYIQEVEVISRGFTMVTPYTPIVRLENSTSSTTRRQCAVLRQSCFTAAKCQFSVLRDATLAGMRELPLLAEIDHVSNYLATVDLQTIAPWFKHSEDDDEEFQDTIAEFTSHFSLSALKAMNSLFCEQRSEFIRRLVLSISPAALLPDQTIDKSVLESWTSIVCGVNDSCEASLGKLQRSYDCHRQRPSHNREQLPSDIQMQAKDGVSSQHRVINAVRSLRLHLEATLNRVISVEDALEEADGSVTKESKVGCLTSEMLDAVKRELTASQDCLQEASSSLEKMNDKHQGMAHSQDRKDDADKQQDGIQDNRIPIPLLPMSTEIEFDDQVFEAYTENEPWERFDEDDWGEGISEQEKLKRRREAEETKRLLQELRSVLSVRKAEREHMKLNRARTDAETNNPTPANEVLQSKLDPNVGIDNTGLECRTSEDSLDGRGLPKEGGERQESSATTAAVHAVDGDMSTPSTRSDDHCELGDKDAMNESESESKFIHDSKQTEPESVNETTNHQSSNNADQETATCGFRDSSKLATAEDEEQPTQLRLPINFLQSLAAEAAKKSGLQAEEMFIGSDEESDE